MNVSRPVFLLVALSTLLPFEVHAVDNKSKSAGTNATERINRLLMELSTCRQIAPPFLRLKCFDAMSVMKDTKKAEEPVEDPNGKWKLTSYTNPMDDTKLMSLNLTAENAPRVSMTIRCNGDKPEVFIRWETRLFALADTILRGGDNDNITRVTIRVDKENAANAVWDRSTDGYAAFAPPDAAKPFVSKLAKGSSLAVQAHRITDPNIITEVFDLKGLSSALKPLTPVCNLE